MIEACATSISPEALAHDVLASADCLIRTQVEQGYAALLAPSGTFVTALTIGLTIYVAVFGYRLMLGLSSLTLAEVVPHFIKIGIVLALATSWASYQTIVFDLLFHGPEQIADVIVRQAARTSADGQGEVLLALQAVFARLTDAASDAWVQGIPPVSAATPVAPVAGVPVPAAATSAALSLPFALGAPQFVAVLLWLSAIVLMAASVGVLLVVRIILALLLLLGPIFVALALFRATRGVFEGWLRITVKFALVPLFTLPLIAVVVAVLAPVSATLGDAPVAGIRSSPALLILLIILVFAAVIVQAARLGGGIAGGIRLPRRAAPRVEPSYAGLSNATSSSFTSRGLDATRADVIVEGISINGRQGPPGSVGTTSKAIVTTRSISALATEIHIATDNSGRLGQGYRRLAVAGSPRPRN